MIERALKRLLTGLGARSGRGYFVLVFLVLSATYWATRGQDTAKVGGDGFYQVVIALSLVQDGDLRLANEYQHYGDPNSHGIVDGVARAPISVGAGLAMAPFVAVALALHGDEPVGRADIYALLGKTACYSAAVLTSLSFLLLMWVAARYTSYHGAAAIAGLSIVGTPLFFYSIFHPSYTHAFTALGCAATLWTSLRWSESPSWQRALWMGAAVGMAGLGRAQYLAVAFFPIAVTLEHALGGRDRLRPAARDLGLAGAAALLVFSIQLFLWVPGGHNPLSPSADHFMHLGDTAWTMQLFSSRNGLFPWSPPALIGLLALPLAFRARPGLTLAGLLLFASMWWINASSWDWHSSWSFGARRFSSCSVVLLLGLVALWQWARTRRPRRIAVLTLCALLGATNLGMALNQGQTDGRTDNNTPMLETYVHGLVAMVAGAGQGSRERRDVVAQPITGALQPLYDLTGNPFSFPMPWWIRYADGLPVERFDHEWGRSLLERYFRNPWPGTARYWAADALVPTVGAAVETHGHFLRVGAPSRLLVPMFMRECVEVRLELTGPGGGAVPEGFALAIDGEPVTGAPTRSGQWYAIVAAPRMLERGYFHLDVLTDLPVELKALQLHTPSPECSEAP